jgi:hypothetical protein
MAKARRANPTPFIIFGLVALAAAAGVWGVVRYGALGTTPRPPVAPALPTGPLQYAGASLTETHYLAGVRRSGQRATADVLVVGETGEMLSHLYAVVAKHETIDCQARTIADELAGAYDAKGTLKTTQVLTGSIGRQMEFTDFEVGAVCQGKPSPAWRAADGWRAAQRASQTPPDDLVATAEANPRDAAAWAWMCHGAPWHWRAQSPKDCDHAVNLQPDAPGPHLDRGFISLATGHDAVARGDFQAVLARDSGNAAGLFGAALVEGFSGDKAAAQRDRDRALALDPTIPDWVERTFRFQVADFYRGR